MNKSHQAGVGLMEVLIALLLLAIGVLGYVALQVRAVDATTESVQRSQAIFVLKGLAESIRANNAGRGAYAALVNAGMPTSFANSCINPATALCTPAQVAADDVIQAKANAQSFGMTLRMADCPGTANVNNQPKRSCLYAAWGNTDITNNLNNCMTNAGVYQLNANCLMMEVY